ncbi:DMT family transporter [Sulfitobacter aestuarii]|uniref:DMT family transporter n=1 Tax=Sulfitobacter aestuarii TaxID=2161676 RepID=A0ABW5U5H9_9RHOB
MRLALLTALAMIAFAANSVLTRLAIDGTHMDPVSFALVRVASGAAMLGFLIALRGGALPLLRRRRWPGAVSLALYMIGFSLAYLTLDAGLGALILFGVVQISMFMHGYWRGAAPTLRQISGAGIAFAGLMLALWPGPGGQADPLGAGLMVLAGLGWAAYTIIGRGSVDPLAATAANFLLCLPLVAVLLPGAALAVTAPGLLLAVMSGGLTSGLGYALWYAVLPRLDQGIAAIVQLSVPLLAILGGAVLLGEKVSLLVLLAAVLVLGGIGWALSAGSPRADRS